MATVLPNPPYSNQGDAKFAWVKTYGSATVSPGAIANGSQATGTVTINGVAVGDYVLSAYGATLGGCTLNAYVSAANTVTWVITNASGASVTPAASTLIVFTVLYNQQGVGVQGY